MKRTKFIALALVVSLMLMGAGYAGWTDVFNATTTIDTGKLEVTLVDYSDPYMDVFLVDEGNVNNQGKLIGGAGNWYERIDTAHNEFYNLKCSAIPAPKEKKITFTFENIFPGVMTGSSFELANTGTVPTAVQSVTITAPTDAKNAKLYKALQGNLRVYLKHENGSMMQLFETGWHGLDDFQNAINDKIKTKGIVLQPGDSLTAQDPSGVNYLWFMLPKDSLNGDDGELESVTIDMKFDFVQSNLYDPAL